MFNVSVTKFFYIKPILKYVNRENLEIQLWDKIVWNFHSFSNKMLLYY